MNFSQLESFVMAAEHLNFTRAAERLYLSQPVLSRQISSLENELGIKLFVRNKKTVHLTPAGKIMYEGGVKLLNDYKALVDSAIMMQGECNSQLTIGYVEGQLFTNPFSEPLYKFRISNPHIQVNLKIFTVKGIKEALLKDEIDVGMVAKLKNAENEAELEYIQVGETQIFMGVPKSNPLSSKKLIRVDDLKNETIVILSQNEAVFETTDILALLSKKDNFPFRTIIVPDVGSLALSLEAGCGIAPINGMHALRNNTNVVLIPTEGFSNISETLTWKRGNQNPALQSLIKAFSEQEK